MKTKRLFATLLCLMLLVTSVITPSVTTYAATGSVKSITLNVQSKLTMYIGSSKTIKVTGVTPKGSSTKVLYESSAPDVVKVTTKGTMKALKAGSATVTVTVTSAVNKNVSKKIKVTVKNLVKNSTQNKAVIPLDKKKTLKLSLIVKAANLSFSSSKKSVATVDNKGNITAKKAGTAKITVKGVSGASKGAKQVITVYVAKKSVKSVSLNKTEKTLQAGKSFQLKTTVNPASAANVVIFKSSKSSVATVSTKGKVTAKKAGTTKITATTIDGKKKVVCSVVVTDAGKPTEATEPTKPATPTEKTEPTKTVTPTESPTVQPTEEGKPTKEATPTVESKPTEAATPTVESKPTEAVTPTQGSKPTEAIIPTQAATPTVGSKPTQVATPTRGSKPTEEVTPTQGSKPTEAVAPTQEEKPTEAVIPTQAATPTVESKPTQAATPTVESKPTQAATPTVESKPTQTVTPTETAKPTEESKPTEKITPTGSVNPTESATPTPVAADDWEEEFPDVSNAVDSDILINEGIQISNGDETLYLGEFIAINAFCFPYAWFNQNNYVLTSSDTAVVTVDKAHVAYAVGVGEAEITAYTMDGKYKDTIQVKVLPEMEHSYNSQKVYDAEIDKFGLTCHTLEDDPLSVTTDIAYNNSNAIMSMLGYARIKGYDVVKLPAGKVIYIDPANTIYMKSGICLDLNGSELRIVPNAYQNYTAINFKEGGINAFAGFVGGTETTYDKYTNAQKFTYTNIGDSVFLEPIPVCEDNNLYDAGNYSGKWLLKGGKIQFNTVYIRDNNANVAIYAHYLKDGKEVFVEKKDALYGMLNNTLLKPSQTMTLTADYDYDSVQFEFRAVYGGTSNYTFCDCRISSLATEKLHNASIVNGTITGERGTKTSTYPNWASDGATEGSCSIIFSQGENNGIKNLTVKDSVGFNMSAGDGNLLNAQYVSYKNLELGAFDNQGNKIDCATMIRNADYYDVTKWSTNKYILGYHFGYQDIEQWSHSRIYDVFYYDKDKQLISYEKGLMRFRQYEMPEGTCYMNIALYDAEVPKSGNSDFNGAISLIEERDLPIRNFIEDCVIENNYSTGFAACGGQRWSIKGNTWRKNGGRMPGCDIDWEDGWNYMQCDMISDNEFASYNNVITCAGMYSSVFKNNTLYGVSVLYPKSNFYAFVGNKVIKDTEKLEGSKGNIAFGTRSDIWIYDNTFTGGGSITNSRAHADADYRINYIGNHFSGGTMLTATGNENISQCDFTGSSSVTSDNIRNCTFVDCGQLGLKGTLTNCTLNNVSIFAANSDHINLNSCDMTDVSLPTGAHKVSTVLIDNCNIKFVNNKSLIGYDKFKPSITVSNSVLDLSKVEGEFALVNAYSVENVAVNYIFKNNQVIKPKNLTGYMLKTSWIAPATAENKLTITLENTNFDELTDCNKSSGNFEIIR